MSYLPIQPQGVPSLSFPGLDRVIRQMLATSLLRPDSDAGFFTAYDALLDAVVEKDREFIRTVCEPVLGARVVAGLEMLESEGMVVRKRQTGDSVRFEVGYLKLMLQLGQRLDRTLRSEDLQTLKQFDSPGIEVSYALESLTAGITGLGSVQVRSLVSVLLEVRTNVGLEIFNPKAPLHFKQHPPPELQTHALQFGFENNKAVSPMTLLELLRSLQTVTDPLSRFDRMIGLFIEENYDWRILDTDYCFRD